MNVIKFVNNLCKVTYAVLENNEIYQIWISIQ